MNSVRIKLDADTAREGLDRYRDLELAQESWNDWLGERYREHGLDPAHDEIEVNPITGRITARMRPRQDTGPADAPSARYTPTEKDGP